MTFQIEFQPVEKRVTTVEGEFIPRGSRAFQSGIDIHSACGGEGNCGQCRVQILEGKTNPLTPDEEFFLSQSEIDQGFRLACCTQIQCDIRVHIPKESLVSGQRLQVEASLGEVKAEPFIKAYPIEMTAPTIDDVRSDVTRVMDALRAAHSHVIDPSQPLTAGLSFTKYISPALREKKWKVNAFLHSYEIVSIGARAEKPLGLAVDLGSTKIAALLVDLESGEVLGSAGAPNPQISYGEDVISRMNYAVRKPNGGEILKSKVQEVINDLLGELTQKMGASRSSVCEACIVGNTAMTHLLLGLPVNQLSLAPYVSANNEPMDVLANELGLQMAPGGRVFIPPAIGGFVGSDHVAMVLGSELDTSNLITLGLDIGTNTEISLRAPQKEELVAVSCASGPAFEGAHIRDGMRAASGAIEKVRISNGKLDLVTINNQPAVGICGSGILDSIAELYKNGLLNERGRMDRSNAGLRESEQGWEFVLVPAKYSGSGRDISITQNDVNEIQLAKGAIAAGLNVLLEDSGIPAEAVQQVIVAGAFGSFLNIQSAIDIGLFPKLPNAVYKQVGNAAAVGATGC